MNGLPHCISPTVRRLITTGRAFVTLALLCGSGHLAFAQSNPNDRAAADALFEAGKAFLKVGNWPSACEKFRLSLTLDPSASTYVKTARCHEHEGRLRAAWADYSKALELVHSRTKANKHARDLEAVAKSAMGSVESKRGRLRAQGR